MGFRGGEGQIDPPSTQHILVFKYPSRDRVNFPIHYDFFRIGTLKTTLGPTYLNLLDMETFYNVVFNIGIFMTNKQCMVAYLKDKT